MFSWLNGNKSDEQSSTNNDNDSNSLTQSIFEETETKETTASNNITPTPNHYPLHAAVIQRDSQSLIKHIQSLPPFDPLLPAKTRPINQKDHHGYTALHLCVYLSFHDGIDILLKHGASVTVRS